MSLFKTFMRPAIFGIEAERAHELSIKALRSGLVPSCSVPDDDRLAVQLASIRFPNPLGLAAGYDKNAEVPDAILSLGFGFTEVGTITPRPQAGNPHPRVFRLVSDKGVINRLGFNNAGHAAALEKLNARGGKKGIVGINIGANKDSDDFVADYEAGIEAFWPVATYFTANISSPNTPGLRNLQARDALGELLDRVLAVRGRLEGETGNARPVFLKIAPDLDEHQMDEIADVANASLLDGLIVSNTTLSRKGLSARARDEAGGLSGLPLFERSTIVLAKMRQRLDKRLPLIGLGGISSPQHAVMKLEAGADLLQLYTGLVFEGPTLASTIVRGLLKTVDERGLSNISDLTGTRTDDWAAKPLSV